MQSSTLKWCAASLFLLTPIFSQAQNQGYAEPDSILFKDGSTRAGVIIKNTADAVFLGERYQVSEFPKSEIVRIFDGVDTGMEFTEAGKKGDLPPWRVMVNDIRNNDAITSLKQIPATLVDNGYLKNVPYLSFRINEYIEMNIYGSPDNPAAIEFGVYGKFSSSDKLRRALRSFLAGFLFSRSEVGAIYSIPFTGGEKSAGAFRIRVTPSSAPDAYGAWWISLYNPKTLAAARVSDAQYANVTLPPGQVVGRSGKVKDRILMEGSFRSFSQLRKGGNNASLFTLGFSRDAAGRLRFPFQGGQ